MIREPSDYRFGKDRRLLNAQHYSPVFDNPDARASHRYLLVLAKRNNRQDHRLGLVIAKKNVRLATQRNRIKRLVRESFRQWSDDGPGMDLVVLARRGIAELDNVQLSSILQQQWQKLTRNVATDPSQP